MVSDAELLHRYVAARSESAFTELVQRHVDLVYAAAWRQTGGDAALAQEVGQRVFTQLARKAARLASHPALVGWLHRTTRFMAIDAVRARQRRAIYEQRAAAMNDPEQDPAAALDWTRVQPILDEALDALGERDRAAVLERFIEGRAFGEIGVGLGLGENAARMRVERALEKLRRGLERRGVTSTQAALAAALGAQGALAAPTGWAATVAPTAMAGAVGAGSAFATVAGFFMNKLTLATLTGLAAVGLTSAGFTWQNRNLRAQNQTLRSENQSLRQLKAAHAASSGGVGAALGELRDADKLTQLVERVGQHNNSRKSAAVVVDNAAAEKRTLQNRGMGAPMETIETFAWACAMGDVPMLAKQIYFDGDGRKLAEAKLAQMPDYLRERYKTPEELYAFFTAADCLVCPPPEDPALLERLETISLKSDRIEVRVRGSSRGRQQYQWTPEGWKMVFPERAIDALAEQVLHTNPMPEAESSPAGS